MAIGIPGNPLLRSIPFIVLYVTIFLPCHAQKLVSTDIFATGFPPMDKIPPTEPAVLALYDLSKVPHFAPKLINNVTGDGICRTNDTTCDWTCFACTRPTDIKTCPQKGVWGLSYDDGPGPFTQGLLDFLDTYSIKAMFFAIGSRVVERPDLLLREFQTGHVVASHTWSHPLLTSLTTEQIVMEMHYSVLAIEKVIGTKPKYTRYPLGDTDDRVRAIFSAMNLIPVIWDRDTLDWTSNNPASHFQPQWIPNNFTQWVATLSNDTTGHISLEHDLFPISATQAPNAIKILQKAGYKIQTPVECNADMRPYVNQSIVIPHSQVKNQTGVGLGGVAASAAAAAAATAYGPLLRGWIILLASCVILLI
ncbi:hypothetical protein SeLEV6574_g03022 [Synchytrium endobioticum]|nr:hypothetical protein SeLEV6574_g03804 [Synchytrium endobioticum]TPX46801.1 hypothetical protein SeLEV6574_g03022 [Synchytrium endobioticum]